MGHTRFAIRTLREKSAPISCFKKNPEGPCPCRSLWLTWEQRDKTVFASDKTLHSSHSWSTLPSPLPPAHFPCAPVLQLSPPPFHFPSLSFVLRVLQLKDLVYLSSWDSNRFNMSAPRVGTRWNYTGKWEGGLSGDIAWARDNNPQTEYIFPTINVKYTTIINKKKYSEQ